MNLVRNPIQIVSVWNLNLVIPLSPLSKFYSSHKSYPISQISITKSNPIHLSSPPNLQWKKRKKVSLPNLYSLSPLDFSLPHVLSCWPSSRGPHILYFPSSYLSSFHHTYKIREQVQTLLQHLPPRLLPLLLRLLKCQPSLSPTAPSTTSLVNVVTPSRSLRHHWVAPPLPSTHARDKTKLCPLDLPRLQLQLLYSTSNAWHLLRPTAPQVTLLSSPVLRGLQPHNTKFKFIKHRVHQAQVQYKFTKHKFSIRIATTTVRVTLERDFSVGKILFSVIILLIG